MAVLPAELARNNVNDTYALLDELVIRGGYRTVADTTERDAIFADVRKIGMLVYLSTPDTFYQLKGGITNSDWVLFSGGGSGFDGNPSSLNQEGATTGQAIIWDGSKWGPANQSGAGFSGAIQDLLQSGGLDRQVVLWNNTAGEWQPTTLLYGDINGTPTLATVATTGDYNDLINLPVLFDGNPSSLAQEGATSSQVLAWNGSAWVPTNQSGGGFSGDITDLNQTGATDRQVVLWVNGSNQWQPTTLLYSDVSGTPTLAAVATSGDYNDLINKPTLFDGNPSSLAQEGASTNQVIGWDGSKWTPTNQSGGGFSGLVQDLLNSGATDRQVVMWNNLASEWQPIGILYTDITGTPVLATVATSGDYNDLINKPPLFDGDVENLNQSGATDGQVIKWNNGALEWQAANETAAAQDLQSVLDNGSVASMTDQPISIINEEVAASGAKTSTVQGEDRITLSAAANKTTAFSSSIFTVDEKYISSVFIDGSGSQVVILMNDSGIEIGTGIFNPPAKYQSEASKSYDDPSDIISKRYADGVKATKTANYTILIGDFKKQPSEIAVGNNTITLTLGAITPTDGTRLEINLYHASGSISLDFSATTVIDSEAAALVSPLTIKAAVLIYDSALNVFKLIGKYS